MVRQRVDPAMRTRNFKARNERFETGALVKSHKGRNVSVERSGRMLSVESNWTVFKRRLLQSQSRCVTQKLGKKKGPSQGIIQKCENEERVPRPPEFEEILRQEQCARKAAWNLAKDVYNLRKEPQDTFYSPAEVWVMPASSSTNPEERQFVIDSGASMHMLSKKDLSSGELDTLTRSRTPMTVVTSNGEVRRMKKRKCMCMIFIFSSISSCSRTLLPYCSLKNFQRARVHL